MVTHWYENRTLRKFTVPVLTSASILFGTSRIDARLRTDFDESGKVDFKDFLSFVDSFGTIPGEPKWDAKYDLDRDNSVNFSDFLLFVDDFGKDVRDQIISMFTDKFGFLKYFSEETKTQYNIGISDDTKKALEGANIELIPTEDGGVIFVTKPDYFPMIGAAKSKIKDAAKIADGVYSLAKRYNERKSFVQSLNEEQMKVLTHWEREYGVVKKETYLRTVDLREKILLDEEFDATFDISMRVGDQLTGANLGGTLISIKEILDEVNRTDAERFDVFSREIIFKKDSNKFFKFIPSNVPSVDIQTPVINDNKIKFSWQGRDSDKYDKIFGFETVEDPTVLFGPTLGPDLTYYYSILQGSKEILKGNTRDESLSVNLEDGDYTLELRVEDEKEAGNSSKKLIDFSVGEKLFDGTILFTDFSNRLGVLRSDKKVEYIDTGKFGARRPVLSGNGDQAIVNLIANKDYFTQYLLDLDENTFRQIQAPTQGGHIFQTGFADDLILISQTIFNWESSLWQYNPSLESYQQLTYVEGAYEMDPCEFEGEIYFRRRVISGIGSPFNAAMRLDSSGKEHELFRVSDERQYSVDVFNVDPSGNIIYTKEYKSDFKYEHEVWRYDPDTKENKKLHTFSSNDANYHGYLLGLEATNNGFIYLATPYNNNDSNNRKLTFVDKNFDNPVVLLEHVNNFDWIPKN